MTAAWGWMWPEDFADQQWIGAEDWLRVRSGFGSPRWRGRSWLGMGTGVVGAAGFFDGGEFHHFNAGLVGIVEG